MEKQIENMEAVVEILGSAEEVVAALVCGTNSGGC